MSIDSVANCLTYLRNACLIKRPTVFIPFTKLNQELVRIFCNEGMVDAIKRYRVFFIVVRLKYEGRKRFSHIRGIQRVSRPGCRVYTKVTRIPSILGGLGLVVLSTSKGVLVDNLAQQLVVGGEILCRIW